MAPRGSSSSKNSALARFQKAKAKSELKKKMKKSKKGAPLLPQEEEYDKKERVLMQFDMNYAYGPCIGMSRLQRWERAKSLGLNPPQFVYDLLKSDDPTIRHECVFQKYNI